MKNLLLLFFNFSPLHALPPIVYLLKYNKLSPDVMAVGNSGMNRVTENKLLGLDITTVAFNSRNRRCFYPYRSNLMKTASVSLSLLLFLWSLFCCGNAQGQIKASQSPLPVVLDTTSGYAPNSSATLIFKEGKDSDIRLAYQDYLNTFIDVIPSKGHDSITVLFRNFLIVYNSYKGGAPFIILPNDRIEVKLDSAKRLVMETNDPVRNAELNLFNKMVLSDGIDFSLTSLGLTLKDFKEASFARSDSVLTERRDKQVALLEQYSSNPLLRPEIVQLSKQFLSHKGNFEKYFAIINRGGTEEELKEYYAHLSKYLQSQKRFSYYFPDFRIIASSAVNLGYVAAAAIKRENENASKEKNLNQNLALVKTFFDSSLVEPVQYLLLNNSLNQKLNNHKEQLLGYAARYPDTDFTSHLKEELAYRESINKNFEGNQLLGQKDATLPLEELMAKKRGKVLYVDFWASW
ncbi:hypothetical protein, partial [Rufibacter ruber]|uniref:hypothetical protein n=1 Tax=Rufibacter ruber TaxID=1783499 RepID=UPI000B17261E